MRRMNRVLWIDPINRMAWIQAGAVGRDIVEQLAPPRLHARPRARQRRVLDARRLDRDQRERHEEEPLRQHRGARALDVDAVTAAACSRASAPRRASRSAPTRGAGCSAPRATLGIVTSAVVKLFPLPEVRRFGSVLFHDFETGFAFLCDVAARGRRAGQRAPDGQPPVPVRAGAEAGATGLAALKSTAREVLRHEACSGFDPERMVACTLLFEGSAARGRRRRSARLPRSRRSTAA